MPPHPFPRSQSWALNVLQPISTLRSVPAFPSLAPVLNLGRFRPAGLEPRGALLRVPLCNSGYLPGSWTTAFCIQRPGPPSRTQELGSPLPGALSPGHQTQAPELSVFRTQAPRVPASRIQASRICATGISPLEDLGHGGAVSLLEPRTPGPSLRDSCIPTSRAKKPRRSRLPAFGRWTQPGEAEEPQRPA